ncbi:TPA: hypothetical protein H2X42_001008 [Salmonella enterica]|nr:hypothetical protein [Salmonella enterica]
MSNVKIYTATPADLSPPVQSESFCVDLVLASDYRELEAKCAALAAENVGLKAALSPEVIPDAAIEAVFEVARIDREWNEVYEFAFVDNEDEVVRAVLNAVAPTETLATDAFLAEMRAQGVERYAAQLKSEAELADEAGWDGAAKFLISESGKVLAFAAQIRQEAAK